MMNKIHFLLLPVLLFYADFLSAQNGGNPGMMPVGSEAFEVMRGFFEYDRGFPAEIQIIEQLDRPDYVREKLIMGGSVPGYLAIPKGGHAPYPCVIQLHGLNSSKESWWEENGAMGGLTRQLLESGYAVLALDAEYHGERLPNAEFKSATDLLEKGWFIHFRDMMIRTVIDYRKVLNYLETRPEVDASKIGLMGYSMGGIMSFTLCAVDPRIKAAVACVAPIVPVPYLPTAVHNSAPYVTQPFLMLMAENDGRNYSVEAAEAVYRLIQSSDKDLIFFESGHMLPPGWTNDAVGWMDKHLRH